MGDTIQGMNDASAEAEWLQVSQLLGFSGAIQLYLAPGNHDIWSPASKRLFQQYAAHPRHYSFDYGQAHFTILDNSRSEELPAQELVFLETDLKAHAGQPVKIDRYRTGHPGWLTWRSGIQTSRCTNLPGGTASSMWSPDIFTRCCVSNSKA